MSDERSDERREDQTRAHYGDPCVFCQVQQKDVAPGACPEAPGLEDRIVIVGCPSAGKTTLSDVLEEALHVHAFHTDDLLKGSGGWSEHSARASDWFDQPGPWIIEGMAVPRALRKWIKRNPMEPRPYTKVIELWEARVPLDDRLKNMARGARTVWREVVAHFG